MASRELRSRAVIVSEETCGLTQEECECDSAVTTAEVLGSKGGTSDATQNDPPETTIAYAPTGLVELDKAQDHQRGEQPELPNLVARAELTGTSDMVPLGSQDLLASVLAAVREGNKQIQESNQLYQENISSKINSLQESNKQLKERVEAKLNELEQSNVNLLKDVRADIQSEINKLTKRFDAETQKLNKEFSEKLHSETNKCASLVGKAQKETEAELTTVKRQMANLKAEINKELGQKDAQNAESLGQLAGAVSELQAQNGTIVARVETITDELRIEVNQVKTQVSPNDHEFQRRQREESERTTQKLQKEISASQSQITQVNLKIREIEAKLLTTNNGDRSADSCLPRTDCVSVLAPTQTVAINDNTEVPNQDSNSVNCSCGDENCLRCVREGVNVSSESTNYVKNPIASNYLNHSDFPLPLFDDGTDMNPVYHLKQLEEFMKLRRVQKEFQLPLAYKSITGTLGKQWVETIHKNINDYESFKEAFLKTWWSDSQQNLVKCNLYQGKYHRQDNLSLSGYFLKYATLASYLQPRISDSEFVEAIRFHFPVGIQKVMLSTQVRSINETLQLLKRLEALENQDYYGKPNAQYSTPQHRRRTNYQPQNQGVGRTHDQHAARRIRYYEPNYHDNYRHDQQQSNHSRGYRQQRNRNTGDQGLNPDATPFQQEDPRDRNQGRNPVSRSEN
jgi:hypothetical protein